MLTLSGRRGEMLPQFMLQAIKGPLVDLETYRGRSNLVVVFAGDALGGAARRLVDGLTAREGELAVAVAQVVVVIASRTRADSQAVPGAYPILLDLDARVHQDVGAVDSAGRPAPAVFVTDRFREIFAAWLPAVDAVLPSPKEVLEWLEFINIQCPECGAPEWPL